MSAPAGVHGVVEHLQDQTVLVLPDAQGARR